LYFTPTLEDISAWHCLINQQDLLEKHRVDLPDQLGKLNFTFEFLYQKGAQKIVLPNKQQQISIRFIHDNPKCLPDYRQQSRPLKKVLQELNIPPWQRKRVPFLYYDDELVAGLGYFVCQSFIPKANDKHFNVYWLDNNKSG
jgi:tRNA(Ile)-lysidine synthase